MLPCFRVIVPHCIVRFCKSIIRNQHLQRFVLHATMLIEQILVFLRGQGKYNVCKSQYLQLRNYVKKDHTLYLAPCKD